MYEAAIRGTDKQEAFVAYDKLNRIHGVVDHRDFFNEAYIAYDYDAVGNRRSVKADYVDSSSTRRHIEDWYQYDFANRLVRTKGVLQLNATTGQNEITQGLQVLYDVDGNRAKMQTTPTAIEIYSYNQEGAARIDIGSAFLDGINPTTIRLDQRQYDAGRLILIRRSIKTPRTP